MHTLKSLKANSAFISTNYSALLAFLVSQGRNEATDLTIATDGTAEAPEELIEAWDDDDNWPEEDNVPQEYLGRDDQDYYGFSLVLGIPNQLADAEMITYSLGI